MESGHQLRFRFRDVEGRAVRLGESADEKQHEGDQVQREELEDQPVADAEEASRLGGHDVGEVEATDLGYDHQNQDRGRDLVADHLGRGPHASVERVLVVRAPAGHQHRESAQRGNRDEVEDPDVEVRYREHHPVFAHPPGNDREGRERARHRENRSQPEEDPVGVAGNEVLLEEQLQTVGEALKQPVPPHPHGTEPILDVGRNLPLEPDRIDGVERQDAHETRGAEKHDDEVLQTGRHEIPDQFRNHRGQHGKRRNRAEHHEHQHDRDQRERPHEPHLDLAEPGDHRSISPRTMSRLPMIAMMSAIISPRVISWKSPIATKQGERPFTR